jgi:hypothetical protein
VAVHRGRRTQADSIADLANGGGIAVFPGEGGDVIQNTLPHRAQFVHNAPRTKHISNNNVFIIAHLFGESKHLFVILVKNFRKPIFCDKQYSFTTKSGASENSAQITKIS